MTYAEVIGDPVAHSRSPLIHQHWLSALQIQGDYLCTLVPPMRLREHLQERRLDPNWRGCNVTIPHKENVSKLVDALDEGARKIGAVNCVVRRDGGLFGTNTDVDGVGAALGKTRLEGAKAVVIGGGGASRAAIAYLAGRNVGELMILVRDPKKAEPLCSVAPDTPIKLRSIQSVKEAIGGATVIVNATPMGMTGHAAMPDELIAALAERAAGATFFDMVYDPVETGFLAAGRKGGAQIVDGLTMLVGQARRAFEMFFEAAPPIPDNLLRGLLTASIGGWPAP